MVCGKSDEEIYSCFNELALSFDEINNKSVRELSGGMKRRVAIARAILVDADLYTFDEAFKGIDDETKRIVIKCILKRLRGKTMIFITHDSEDERLLSASKLFIDNVT